MKKKRRKNCSVSSIFMYCDCVDLLLMVLGLAGAVADGLLTPVVLFISSKFLNNIGSASDLDANVIQDSINKNAMAIVYVAFGSWVSCFLEGYCWTRTGERQSARMRARYLKAVLRQDVGFFDLNLTSISEVISGISKESLVIQDAISEKVPNFVMNLSIFIGCYIVAFLMLWRLALVGFPFLILLVIPGLIYGKTLTEQARKLRTEYNHAGSIPEQAISSIRTVYAFVGEKKTVTKYSEALNGCVNLGLKQGLAKGLAIGSNGIVFGISAFLYYYGSRMVMYHGAQGGTVYNVGAAIAIGGLSLGSGISNLKHLSEAISASERIMEVIDRIPDIDSENPDGQILENFKGDVEFKHVQFAYPSRPESLILSDFSLKISAGMSVALVGESGSGKSTVLSLLQRFYDPIGGAILLDGLGIGELNVKWLRSQMGLVNQEPALFATSVRENIVFGKECDDMDDVVDAAMAANAHHFISQMPQAYDTQVGEKGIQMSGGQKQRIAIARAIIKKPRILLLDEATSALDSESERLVQQALDNAVIGRTTLIVAHRLSTIRNADLIAVVQNGQISEIGSHENLIRHENSHYASLFRIQQTDLEKKGTDLEICVTAVDGTRSVDLSKSGNLIDVASGEGTTKRQPPPSFRRLFALNLPEWKQAAIGCLSAFLFGAVQPVYAFVMGSMVSVYFLKNHDEIREKTRIYALIFVGLAVFSLVINVLQHYSFAFMGEILTKRIREMMISKILTFEIGWFDDDQNSSGAVCSRLDKDANVVRSLVGDRISIIVQTFSAVTIACIMGLIISWKLAIVMIAIQPLIILCFYIQKILLKSMSEKSIKSQNQSTKLAAESISNIRTITSFSSQNRILKLFEQAQQIPRRESIKQSWFAGIVLATSRAVMALTWALHYWYGGKLISEQHITAKALFETFMILLSTGRVVAEAGSMTTDLAKGSDAVAAVFTVLDRIPEFQPDDPDAYRPENLTGGVEFCDVEFSYPSRPDVLIFKDFSITFEAGKSTAVVGQSGSGKSTIFSLIERFYDPTKGVIKIDGRDLRKYNLRSLRKHIALVNQEPTLFSGTIRENIVYGTSEKTEMEIMKASKVANAHDFVSGLINGYDTMCGDRGIQLSGGQKQRIAIARAVLKNPKILLLDEATSALDGQSESVVHEAIERVMEGRTSVVVAHRLSTVRGCDMIAVLDKGRVVEKGTHSALLSMGPRGYYYSLVGLQISDTQTSN